MNMQGGKQLPFLKYADIIRFRLHIAPTYSMQDITCTKESLMTMLAT